MSAAKLFDFDAFDEAHLHPADSPWRRLVLSEEPEVAALRETLQACWAHAGASRASLRAGLAHVRWGQHAGALAQLLALGLVLHEGWSVTSEPELSGLLPDLLATRNGARCLVEVRALTGCGLSPWDDGPPAPPRPAPRASGRRGADERARRAEARRLAEERAKAEAAVQRDLGESVARALEAKADAYAGLCAAHDLPLVVALYEDTDEQLAGLATDWVWGPPPRRDPAEGGPGADPARFGHVAGVIVFGREAAAPPVRLRGAWLPSPVARTALPDDAFPHLRRLDPGPDGPRWSTPRATPFELALPPAPAD